MSTLPDRPHPDHLREQAKDLLRAVRDRDPAALVRLRTSLPGARPLGDDALATHAWKLHDCQSCVAREYGFASWARLMERVHELRDAVRTPIALADWLRLAYALGFTAARPLEALARSGDLAPADRAHPAVACALGEDAAVRAALAAGAWRDAPQGPLAMPPLIGVTFSSLLRVPGRASGLRACARALLEAGVDPGVRWTDPAFPDSRLSALHGAAGRAFDVELTRMLLAAGAQPDDGESLYHATEGPTLDCVRALLEAGARIQGTNAFFHELDRERPEGVALFLAHGADPNETLNGANALLWALHRGRSEDIVNQLLDAGADVRAVPHAGGSLVRFARRAGLDRVAARLAAVLGDEPDDDVDSFLGACSRADEAGARGILARRPTLLAELEPGALRLLPDAVANGRDAAARLMVTLGWPIAARGGDWSASALNLAVFRGAADLARFLLEHGADWRERHGHQGDVCGTLSFASRNEITPGGDWAGCAAALLDHGMPVPPVSGDERFGPEVEALFAARRAG